MPLNENTHRIGELERRMEDVEHVLKGSSGQPGVEANQLLMMNHLYNPNDGLLKEFKKMRDFNLKLMGGFGLIMIVIEVLGLLRK